MAEDKTSLDKMVVIANHLVYYADPGLVPAALPDTEIELPTSQAMELLRAGSVRLPGTPRFPNLAGVYNNVDPALLVPTPVPLKAEEMAIPLSGPPIMSRDNRAHHRPDEAAPPFRVPLAMESSPPPSGLSVLTSKRSGRPGFDRFLHRPRK